MSLDVEKYHFQLNQINESLLTKPDDPSLLLLKEKIEQLIQQQLLSKQTDTQVKQPVKSHNKIIHNVKTYKIGETCLCLYEDGHKYEAVVVGVEDDQYEIAFTGYDEIKIVNANQLFPSVINEEVNEAVKQKVLCTHIIVGCRRYR
jgi:hypothetical protein